MSNGSLSRRLTPRGDSVRRNECTDKAVVHVELALRANSALQDVHGITSTAIVKALKRVRRRRAADARRRRGH